MPDDAPDDTEPRDPSRLLAALRSWARREPVLAIRTVQVAVTLVAWAVTRWLDFNLDEQAILAYAGLLLGLDTLVTHESVYSPATVERERAVAADEALLAAPIAPVATVVQVGADLGPCRSTTPTSNLSPRHRRNRRQVWSTVT